MIILNSRTIFLQIYFQYRIYSIAIFESMEETQYLSRKSAGMSGLGSSRVRVLCDCIDWHVRISYHHYHSQELESDYEKYFSPVLSYYHLLEEFWKRFFFLILKILQEIFHSQKVNAKFLSVSLEINVIFMEIAFLLRPTVTRLSENV